MNYKIFPISEQAVTLQIEQRIDPLLNDQILFWVNYIREKPFDGFREVVPAYASLTVFYNLVEVQQQCRPGQTAFSFVAEWLKALPKGTPAKNNSVRKEIPVSYEGPDLLRVAEINGLSEKEVIEMHSSAVYRVYMLGFLPGFAYLGGLDEKLTAPRLETPRIKVPAGSVAIGGNQTGIYPFESPGGWNIIGHSDIQLFDYKLNRPSFLVPGDEVVFCPV